MSYLHTQYWHRRCSGTCHKTEVFRNSQSNLCPKCPNNTNYKLTANGTFTEPFSTCCTCCHMATLQHYTFHRCIHANFTKFIHIHGVQSCFKKKKTHKQNTKIMLLTLVSAMCHIKKFPTPLLWHISAGDSGYIYYFQVLVNRLGYSFKDTMTYS